MTGLIAVRNSIRDFLRKYDEVTTPILRFIFSFIVFSCINSLFGYSEFLHRGVITFLLSVICALVTGPVVVFLAGVVVAVHCFSVSMDVGVLSAIGFLLTPQIVTLLGAKGAEMQANSILYGRILFVGIPFMVLQQTFLSFYVAAEKPSLSLKISILAGVINMILDYVLIVPLDMGLAGAALATILSQAVGGIFPVIYFLRKNSSLLRLQFPFPMHWKALWIACANGSSEMVSNLSVSLVSMLYNYQLMRLVGEDGISAYGVLMYVSVVFNAVFMGYSIGSAPIVSYHYGAKNHAELKNLFQKGLWLISGSSVIITALAIVFAKQQAMIFTSHDADLMALTIQACQIYSIAYLFKGINTWASSFFTALNNGLVSALISFLRTFLFEIAAILILPALFGVLGIWFSVVAAELAALVVSIAFLVANRKKYQY